MSASWIATFAATFLALVVQQYVAEWRRRENLRQQGAAEERARMDKDLADAEKRAADVVPGDRDSTVRDLRGGVF